MSIMFVKRSTLPAPVKGKVGTLSVMIGKNGQVQLSKMAHDFIGGNKLAMGFDGGKAYLFKTTAPLVVKNKTEEKDFVTLNTPKKGGSASFAGSTILKNATQFGASHVYPYAESGNQTFSCVKDEKNGCLVFDLPASPLTPRPVTPRAKKPKVAAVAAAPGDNSGSAVGVETELDLVEV